MEGGAWNSGVYDNGRDFQKARAPRANAASAMESGTPPAMYNPSPAASVSKDARSCGILIVLLRSVLILLSFIAFGVMVSSKDKFYTSYEGTYSTSYYEHTIKFSSIKSFVGLLSLDIIVAVYAIVQLVICFVQKSRTGTFVSSPTASGSFLTFCFDAALACALIGAGGAAADSRYLWADDGSCDVVPVFCRKAAISIAVSFFAFAILATAAVLYPVRLLRLSK